MGEGGELLRVFRKLVFLFPGHYFDLLLFLAMANFQAFFPKIVKKLWMLEVEDHNCPATEVIYKKRISVRIFAFLSFRIRPAL
jgi:hypothetical protein